MNLEESAVLEAEESKDSAVETPEIQITELSFTVKREYGLHARPATRASELFNTYNGRIGMVYQAKFKGRLKPKEECENPRSVINLITCALDKGSRVYLTFTGEQLSEKFKEKLESIFNNGNYLLSD